MEEVFWDEKLMSRRPSRDKGHLTVFAGNMASDKSGYLIIKAQNLAEHGQCRMLAIKPKADKRNPGLIWSRRGIEIKAIEVSEEEPQKILEILEAEEARLGEKVDVLVLDEIQFYPAESGFFGVIKGLLDGGYDVLAAGLTLNFRGEPFGPTLWLAALAQKNCVWLNAVCTMEINGRICGEEAMFPQRFNHDKTLAPYDAIEIVIGDEDKRKANYYEARCAAHFVIPKKTSKG